jgi:hypothetical protein
MTHTSSDPPRRAVALLARRLPLAERDMILGDLTEVYADRVDRGARFNRLWFWLQAFAFCFGFAASPRARIRGSVRPRRQPMERVLSTLRQTLRRLRFEWRYAGGVIVILAIGIGPAAAMLSVVQKVLLAPLPYAEPDRLAIARLTLGQIQNHPGLSRAEITDLRELSAVFAAVEGASRRGEVSVGPNDGLEPMTSIAVTPGLFRMLGVSPIRGRHFTDADVQGDTRRVLIGYQAWRSSFAGAENIVGRVIRLDGQQAEVIGVLPEGFRLTIGRGVPEPLDVYMPLLLDDNRSFWAFPTIVRLADGVTLAQANERVAALTAALSRDFPDVYTGAELRFELHPLLDDMVRETRPAMRAALAGVFLLLAHWSSPGCAPGTTISRSAARWARGVGRSLPRSSPKAPSSASSAPRPGLAWPSPASSSRAR